MEKTIHKDFKVVKAKAQKVSEGLNRLRARAMIFRASHINFKAYTFLESWE
jgi:hypothetical protein